MLRLLLLFLLFTAPLSAQEDLEPIDASNSKQLASFRQVDFDDNGPLAASFVIAPDGRRLALIDDVNGLIRLWDDSGQALPSVELTADLVGLAFVDVNTLAIAQQAAESLTILWHELTTGVQRQQRIEDFSATVLDAWSLGEPDGLWFELFQGFEQTLAFVGGAEMLTLPYAPAQDLEAVVRIGRIPPPYEVTSSESGSVKLWDLTTGAVLREVDNGTGQPAVFGAINAAATHLAWRDEMNAALYLLDFETGDNRLIAELNGAYPQFLFLSDDTSLILGVNVDFVPNVVVWDVATGQRTDLGAYRECSRVPDMARLSADGSTLVIGCDTGLDIWRVRSP